MHASAQPPVVVIGSGPAGLAAAYRVHEAGWPVVVLEAGDRAGGKMRTTTQDGFVMDEGAAVLSSKYDSLLGLARDVGLGQEIVPGPSGVGIAAGGGVVHYLDTNRLLRSGLRTQLLSPRSKLAMAKFGLDYRKMRPVLDPEDLSLAAAFDTESLATYCQRRLNREILESVIDPTIRGMLGTRAADVSKVEIFFWLDKILGARLFSFRRGFSTYPERLAELLDIRLHARAVEVAEVGRTVRVVWEDEGGRHHTEEASACILACDGRQVPQLVPELDPDSAAFLRSLRYTAIVNLNVALGSVPAGVNTWGILVSRQAHDGMMAIGLEHTTPAGRAPAGRGLLALYTMTEWAEQLIDQPDDEVVAKVLKATDHVVPGLVDDVLFTRVNRWRTAVGIRAPGSYAAQRAFQQSRPRDGRVHLAGDYFASSNTNSSSASGERAARDLLRVLGASAA